MGRLHHILALATAAAVKRDCVCDPPYSHSKPIPVPSNLTAPLPKQLVLIKVPETGSSTTAQLLADLAARRRIPCWVPGAWKDNTPLSFEDAVEKTGKHVEKWALAHRGAGDWVSENFNQAFVIGTTRRPEARLTSWAAKHPKRPCQQGASIGLKFYGIAGSSKTNASEALAQIRQRFSSWFVLERYNESLVAFALRHRLPLGEVLPLLAKYHGGSTASALTCDAPGVRQLLDTEAAVHEHASQQLDETLAVFRHVLDVDALLKAFENALDGMMARGRWRNNSETGRAPERHCSSATARGSAPRRPWTRRCASASTRRMSRRRGPRRRRAGTFSSSTSPATRRERPRGATGDGIRADGVARHVVAATAPGPIRRDMSC